jgi:hypothetical protein
MSARRVQSIVQSMTRRRLSAGVTGPLMATLATLLAAATAVSGCTTHIADSVPAAIGGLPESVPPRPATAPEFPAVGDRPAARADALLSEDERKKLKDDLTASRNHAAKLAPKSEPAANEKPAKKKLAAPASAKDSSKKKSEPATTGSVSAAGATPNP